MNFVLADGKLLEGFRAPLLAGLIAMAVTWFVTPFVTKFAIKSGAVDDPKADDRRVHTKPIPRWGGIAILAGVLVSTLVMMPIAYRHSPFPVYLIGILLSGLLIVVMGALDDVKQFRPLLQASFLLVIGVAVQLFVTKGDSGHIVVVQIQGTTIGGHWLGLGLFAIPLTAFYIFVMAKTMDTIDGVDGLAAGIAAICATTLSLIATYFVFNHPAIEKSSFVELPRVAIIAAAIAGSAIGFLRYNYNPAKIFMGTGGAQLLGFMLAALSIVGVLKIAITISLLIPVLAFGVPLFDAAFVIVRRLLSGQPITQGDKRHLHHTLLAKGLSQRKTVWVLWCVTMMLCALLGLAVVNYG
jgi:UDP-GlcNAc:undecaprenyl-phosphate GlcNAc-1-phosphate transferase